MYNLVDTQFQICLVWDLKFLPLQYTQTLHNEAELLLALRTTVVNELSREMLDVPTLVCPLLVVSDRILNGKCIYIARGLL